MEEGREKKTILCGFKDAAKNPRIFRNIDAKIPIISLFLKEKRIGNVFIQLKSPGPCQSIGREG